MPGNRIDILEYKGHLQFETIGALLNKLKKRLENESIPLLCYKKILSIMIEALENVYKYREHFEDEKSLEPEYLPQFILSRDNTYYTLTTKNPVQKNDVVPLTRRIEKINSLNRDGVKTLYKKTISNGKFTNKGGAGLGFIEMAKVSGNKLKIHFDPINKKYDYFTLQIFINNDEPINN